MIRTLATAALAVSLGTGAALAGPAGDMARDHFDAIGAGDVYTLSGSYAPDAVFQWIGGPLDGVYTDTESISTVWTKFTNAQGPLEAEVASLRESANPKGTTVTADVVFKGKNTIPVRYVLVYRDAKLVSEVWQIDPALK